MSPVWTSRRYVTNGAALFPSLFSTTLLSVFKRERAVQASSTSTKVAPITTTHDCDLKRGPKPDLLRNKRTVTVIVAVMVVMVVMMVRT